MADSSKSRKSRARSARRIGNVKRKWMRKRRPPHTAIQMPNKSPVATHLSKMSEPSFIEQIVSSGEWLHVVAPDAPDGVHERDKDGEHGLNLRHDQHAQRED